MLASGGSDCSLKRWPAPGASLPHWPGVKLAPKKISNTRPHMMVSRLAGPLLMKRAETANAVRLIVRNATLPDGRKDLDIAIANGRIAAVEPHLDGTAQRIIDARGHLVTRRLSTCISTWTRRAVASGSAPHVSGTLLEALRCGAS